MDGHGDLAGAFLIERVAAVALQVVLGATIYRLVTLIAGGCGHGVERTVLGATGCDVSCRWS